MGAARRAQPDAGRARGGGDGGRPRRDGVLLDPTGVRVLVAEAGARPDAVHRARFAPDLERVLLADLPLIAGR